MLRNLLITLSLVLCLSGLTLAANKAVRLKDGRVLVGEVTKTDDGYVIKMKLGEQTVKADDVVSIVDVVTPEEEFKQRLAKVDKSDPEARYDLAQWAFTNGLLDEARSECEAALKLRPKFERADLLLKQISARSGGTTVKPNPRVEEGTSGSLLPDKIKAMLVSEADVQRIRLIEARFSPSPADEGPRGWDDNLPVNFKNKILDTFIEGMAGKPPFDRRNFDRSFRTWRDTQKLSFMLKRLKEAGCEDLSDNIEVKQNPRVMVEFRSRIWPIISGYCGAAQCHGGDKLNGGFRLLSLTGRDEVDYTNFLMLTATKIGSQRMIDRSQYEKSLLLQFGLPSTLAELKHPKERPPLFKSKQDPKYQLILAWMRALAGTRLPDYRLEWVPPRDLKIELKDAGAFDLLDRPSQPKKSTGGGVDDLPIRKE